MKKKKSKIIIFLVSLSFIFLFFNFTNSFYQNMPDPDDPLSTIETLIKENIANWLYMLIFAGGIIGVLIGSYFLLSGSTDSSKINTGKKIIIYSIIAVFIASFAIALVDWTKGLFQFP